MKKRHFKKMLKKTGLGEIIIEVLIETLREKLNEFLEELNEIKEEEY